MKCGLTVLPGAPAISAALIGLMACSPALDWRETRPPGLGLVVNFPCRATTHARKLSVAGRNVEMVMHACSEHGMTFSISMLDATEPALVGPMLAALGDAAVTNIAGKVESDEPASVPGMTPHPRARHQVISGRLPDGRRVTEHLVLFSRGVRLYQAAHIGDKAQVDVAQRFIDHLGVVQ